MTGLQLHDDRRYHLQPDAHAETWLRDSRSFLLGFPEFHSSFSFSSAIRRASSAARRASSSSLRRALLPIALQPASFTAGLSGLGLGHFVGMLIAHFVFSAASRSSLFQRSRLFCGLTFSFNCASRFSCSSSRRACLSASRCACSSAARAPALRIAFHSACGLRLLDLLFHRYRHSTCCAFYAATSAFPPGARAVFTQVRYQGRFLSCAVTESTHGECLHQQLLVRRSRGLNLRPAL